jgi:uncharacterized protein
MNGLLFMVICFNIFNIYINASKCICRFYKRSYGLPVAITPDFHIRSSFVHSIEYYQSNNNNLKNALKKPILWYKDYLSPIMPPNCRFIPSCSSYGLDAIEEYGPWKGAILTAWRILRCNPTGGSGYDPPVWPPPNYFAGSTTGKF